MPIDKLTLLLPCLKDLFPTFKWCHLSSADVEREALFEPSCAALRGTMGPFVIEIHEDGQGAAEWRPTPDNRDYVWFPELLDMGRDPMHITVQLTNAFRNWDPTAK